MQLLLRAQPAEELTCLPAHRLDRLARARRGGVARDDLEDAEGLVPHPHRHRICGGEARPFQLLPSRRIGLVGEAAGEDRFAARPGGSRKTLVRSQDEARAEQLQILPERGSDMAGAAMDQLAVGVDEPGETDVESEVLAERAERS